MADDREAASSPQRRAANPTHAILAFNRGLVSRLALARVDLKRMALSAERQTNWMPRAVGTMMLRPGLRYLTSSRSNATAKYLPFVFGTDDTALIELTDTTMRVLIDDVVITRPVVSSVFYDWTGAAYTAGTDYVSEFANLANVDTWRDNDESGATSSWAAGYLYLAGTGTAAANRDRYVDVGANANVEHAFDIYVLSGNATIRIGSTEGGEEYLGDRVLRPGYHSIAITPTGGFYVRLSNGSDVPAYIDYVRMSRGGDMLMPTPWGTADLKYVRADQSGDVIFVACKDQPQMRIERQGADSPRSWSVVQYLADDGPFRPLNTGPTQLKSSALSGEVTLTASRAFFQSDHAGSLFALDSRGQQVTETFTSDSVGTDPIRVTGVGDTRSIQITLSGIGTSTVRLQRSVAEPGDWQQVQSYTSDIDAPYIDGLDNQIIYYRFWVESGEYQAPDSIDATLTFSAGSITGIVRVMSVTNSTSAAAVVLQALGKADQFTSDWREGDWSTKNGFPSAVVLHDGRLWWFGKGYEWGSVSDAFDSFDDTIEDDSAPIRRSIGAGPIDCVNWGLSGQTLMIGFEGNVSTAKSSATEEPLTQTKFSLKSIADTGTAAIPAQRVDTSVIYVGFNERRVYEIAFDGYAYKPPGDLMALVPEIGDPGFVRMAFQRTPDRRLHCVRSDGSVAVLIFDKLENVTCWVELEIGGDGFVEDVVVLPGSSSARGEDRVYYLVRRTIDGSTVRYLEKWAMESQCQGAADSRCADSHVIVTTPGTSVTGLDHLEGESVVVWQDGICPEDDDGDIKTYTVSSGGIELDTAITSTACIGLSYTAEFKSAKLTVATQAGIALTRHQKVDTVALVLADAHNKGIQFGQSFDVMDEMPRIEEGVEVDPDHVWDAYDQGAITVPGEWTNDARLCLKASAPRPCTVLAAVLSVSANE